LAGPKQRAADDPLEIDGFQPGGKRGGLGSPPLREWHVDLLPEVLLRSGPRRQPVSGQDEGQHVSAVGSAIRRRFSQPTVEPLLARTKQSHITRPMATPRAPAPQAV